MSIECEHGQLARACNICEYEREIAELKAEIECYRLTPDEKTKLISDWQKRSFDFENELSRLIADIAELKHDLEIANGGIRTLDELMERKEAKLSRLTAALEKIARGSDDVVALGDRNIAFDGDYAREIARTALRGGRDE